MNKGVEILLERMSSNPDEFLPEIPSSEYPSYPEKWVAVISAVYARKNRREGHAPFYDLSFLSDEDVDALFNKLQEIRGDHFTKCVMSTLLTDDSSEKERESITYKSKNRYTTLQETLAKAKQKELEELNALLGAYEEKVEAYEKKKAKELTMTQKRIAEKLNVSYDDYAKKVSEIEARE